MTESSGVSGNGELPGTEEPVLLLHGIWMMGLEMALLQQRLIRSGFRVERFRYASLRRSPADNAERLHRHILARGYTRLHLVAHSLGGIVLMHLFARHPRQPPGRVVMLGSPVRGSAVARRLATHRWSAPLIGRAGEQGLVDGAPNWSGEREMGVVAGTSGMGIGRLIGGVSGISDGTVALAETEIEQASDRCQIATGHMGLLVSKAVAREVAEFLTHGRFTRGG